MIVLLGLEVTIEVSAVTVKHSLTLTDSYQVSEVKCDQECHKCYTIGEGF